MSSIIVRTYESKSGGKPHTTKHDPVTGFVTCSCRGFRSPNQCWHVRDIVESRGEAFDKPAARVDANKPVEPMLATTMDKAAITNWKEWAIEEKFDGHRAIVMVVNGDVTAWSRSGKSRELPSQVERAFSLFPNGLYDGELMGKENGTFADVRRAESQSEAYFVVFDVLNFKGDNVMSLSYSDRRDILWNVFSQFGLIVDKAVRKATSENLSCEADVVAFVSKVWERGGEGAILKRLSARYQPGKRSADFVKVKKGGTCVTVVTGFESGKRGPFSVIKVRTEEDGIDTTVKNESKFGKPSLDWIGKRFRIEYTDIKDGAVVNPRGDRWEDK